MLYLNRLKSFVVYFKKFRISSSFNTWPQSCNTKFILHAKMPYLSIAILFCRSTKLISWLSSGNSSAFRLHMFINTERAVFCNLMLRYWLRQQIQNKIVNWTKGSLPWTRYLVSTKISIKFVLFWAILGYFLSVQIRFTLIASWWTPPPPPLLRVSE